MTAIWSSNTDGLWQALEPAGYPAEAALHDLVQQAPQMLPLAGSPRLTVLGREVRLGSGSAYLQFWRSVFERRAPHSIPVVEAAAQTEIRQGNTPAA